jgi:peptidoglycan/LPS O-acetylase OafA/YrhL
LGSTSSSSSPASSSPGCCTQHTAQTFSYRQFYLSRAKRIIPAYLALIVICSLVFALLLIR